MDGLELKVKVPKNVSFSIIAYLKDGTATDVCANLNEMKVGAEVKALQREEKKQKRENKQALAYKNSKSTSEINEKTKEIATLKEQREDDRRRVVELTAKLAYETKIRTTIQQQLEEVKRENKQALADLELKSTTELNKKTIELATAKEEREADKKKVNEMTVELADETKKVMGLRHELEKGKRDNKALADKESKSTAEKIEKTKEIASLKEQLEDSNKKYAELNAKLLAKETEKITGLQQELEKQKRENKQALADFESKSTAELNKKTKELTSLKEKLEREKAGRNDEKRKITELEHKLKKNPKVFFDMSIGGSHVGRIIIELFADVVPRTAEHYRALCTGEKGIGRNGKRLHYKGSPFQMVVPGLYCRGGDFTVDYDVGASIYGDFAEENFVKKHTGPGILSVINDGPAANTSQFLLFLNKNEWYDGKGVVFGQVVEGMDVVWAIEKVGSSRGTTSKKVVIENCGQLS